MPSTVFLPSGVCVSVTTLRERLLNVYANPGDVFEEIATQPYSRPNWLVPTLLVCFFGIISTLVSPAPERTLASALAVIASAFAGTFWSAFVIWFVGRVFLKAGFPFLKAVEVVGLSSMILVLGTVVTSLLMVASGDAASRPALSFLIQQFDPTNKFHSTLDALNIFYLWATVVLAMGLSKLSSVSFKEAAFWVIGYWMVLRLVFVWL